MANGTKYQKMSETYAGDWAMYGYLINFFARFLYQKYYHRLSGQSMQYWALNADAFRKAIWLKVCFDKDANQDIMISYDEFAVFGWIDGMQHQTCRPEGGPIDDEDNRRPDENQV